MEKQQIQEIIQKQKVSSYFEKLCPVKEEMTILGYWINGNRYKSYFTNYSVFSTYSIIRIWNKLVENKFKYSEYELKSLYSNDENIDFNEFIEACRNLAQNVTVSEYGKIQNKVNKMYHIRNLCDEIYYTIEDKDGKEKFEYNISILANSKRIESISLREVKKFLTSYNTKRFDDVIENSSKLSNKLTEFLEHKTVEQDIGIELPFSLLNKAINGLRKGQLIATGMMSNDGKTRLMIRLISNLALKQNKKVLIISNEMTEEEIKYCFITTVLNNKEFKELFQNIDITKTEREIRNGVYSNEDELEKVKQITSYLEEKFVDNVIIIHTTQYSAEDLKDIIMTHYIESNIDYFFYDTLKADIENISNWDGLKAIATVLSELAKEYNISIWTNIQLVNRPQPLLATIDNIANSKQLYHVLDTLLLFVPVSKSEYARYLYWNSSNNPNKDNTQKLDTARNYYACQILKNRIGAKPNLLFEVNLDKNTWEEVGQVANHNDVKRFLI